LCGAPLGIYRKCAACHARELQWMHENCSKGGGQESPVIPAEGTPIESRCPAVHHIVNSEARAASLRREKVKTQQGRIRMALA
jgi:hypothetical protein